MTLSDDAGKTVDTELLFTKEFTFVYSLIEILLRPSEGTSVSARKWSNRSRYLYSCLINTDAAGEESTTLEKIL